MKINKKGQADSGIFSNLILMVIFLVVVSVAGLLAGLIYFDLNILQSTLMTIDFPIPTEDNSTAVALNMSHFQDIMRVVVYPILGLKDSLPYLTYFMVFGFIIALGMTAYLSSKNPIFFVLHLLFMFLMTYFCIIISNMYISLMSNPFINSMMVPFVIYNKLMFYLPQIVFFTSLLFGAISFINIIKPQSAAQSTGLNYGGDY
jgi:hypothetical protein